MIEGIIEGVGDELGDELGAIGLPEEIAGAVVGAENGLIIPNWIAAQTPNPPASIIVTKPKA